MQAQARGPTELKQRGCQLALHLTSPEKPSLLPLKRTQASFKRDCPTGRPRRHRHRSLGLKGAPPTAHPKPPPGSVGAFAAPTTKVLGSPNHPHPQKNPGRLQMQTHSAHSRPPVPIGPREPEDLNSGCAPSPHAANVSRVTPTPSPGRRQVPRTPPE